MVSNVLWSLTIGLENQTIAVIGLGYVGLPLAIEFGKKRSVIGFDKSVRRIEELLRHHDRTLEVSKEDFEKATFLTFTAELRLLKNAKIFIVTVPTPVDKGNRPDLTLLTEASEAVGRVITPGSIVIFESTVYPGATEEVCVPILEQVSGLNYLTEDNSSTAGFYCAYSPERINPGDKNHRLTNIIKITSGSTPQIATEVDELYSEIIIAGTFKAKSIKVAEAAKVIENAQRDLNIAFMNELSMIFKIMGLDTQDVLDAAGTKWNFLPFRPGLVGGHCIGVDPYYLTYKAYELGYIPQIILSGRRLNDEMALYVARSFIYLLEENNLNVKDCVVGVLGITFKENCPDVRNSKIIDMIEALKEWGISVRVMDPIANLDDVKDQFGITVSSNLSALEEMDSLIVAVAHDEIKTLSPSRLRSLCRGNGRPVIADLKACYNRLDLEAVGFTVFRL